MIDSNVAEELQKKHQVTEEDNESGSEQEKTPQSAIMSRLEVCLAMMPDLRKLAVRTSKDEKRMMKIYNKYQLKNALNTNRLFKSKGRSDQQQQRQ